MAFEQSSQPLDLIEDSSAVECVDVPVELYVGGDEVGWHRERCVEIGKGGIRVIISCCLNCSGCFFDAGVCCDGWFFGPGESIVN